MNVNSAYSLGAAVKEEAESAARGKGECRELYTHTHARTRARTHALTHARTHALYYYFIYLYAGLGRLAMGVASITILAACLYVWRRLKGARMEREGKGEGGREGERESPCMRI